jgi:hypothetical protein
VSESVAQAVRGLYEARRHPLSSLSITRTTYPLVFATPAPTHVAMSQVKRKSSLSQLQSSISDTLSSALTFVKENSFKSSRSNSPSGSFRSFRIMCDDLCGRVSDDLSRGPTSHPRVIAAQPGPVEPPATRCFAPDRSFTAPATPTTPATVAQTALQQSDGSSSPLASPATIATFDQEQIQRAARLWATEVPLTDAMSRSELALMPSSSRSHGELAGTTRDSSPAKGSNAPVSRFSIDESSEEEDEAKDGESIDYESGDEDEQSDDDEKEDAQEYATALIARTLTIRKCEYRTMAFGLEEASAHLKL